MGLHRRLKFSPTVLNQYKRACLISYFVRKPMGSYRDQAARAHAIVSELASCQRAFVWQDSRFIRWDTTCVAAIR